MHVGVTCDMLSLSFCLSLYLALFPSHTCMHTLVHIEAYLGPSPIPIKRVGGGAWVQCFWVSRLVDVWIWGCVFVTHTQVCFLSLWIWVHLLLVCAVHGCVWVSVRVCLYFAHLCVWKCVNLCVCTQVHVCGLRVSLCLWVLRVYLFVRYGLTVFWQWTTLYNGCIAGWPSFIDVWGGGWLRDREASTTPFTKRPRCSRPAPQVALIRQSESFNHWLWKSPWC